MTPSPSANAVVLNVSFEFVGEPTVEQKRAAIAEIKSHLKTVLVEDFGKDAWGGYDGPFVKNVRATMSEKYRRGAHV